jgi:hypothetical protein
MRTRFWSFPLLLGLVAVLGLTSPALALPPLPSSFWGTVTINGAPAPEGTLVQATIGGTVYAETHTTVYNGAAVFGLNVPGDDPSTPAIEGGVEGSAVSFRVARVKVLQAGTWSSGTNVEQNLVGALHTVYLPFIQRKP